MPRIAALSLALLAPVLLASLLLGQSQAAAEEYIGGLRNVTGEASVLRDGKNIPAEHGLRICAGDELITGADGAMGIIFNDNTRISLGPGSRLAVNSYVFEPAKGGFDMLLDMIRGTASYISGTMAKLAPESVRVQTPTAVIGVRGTSFLVKVDPENSEDR